MFYIEGMTIGDDSSYSTSDDNKIKVTTKNKENKENNTPYIYCIAYTYTQLKIIKNN